ncbi:aminopeptidase N [Intrasporangium calvum]|uniref:Aminopeptidase N n=1 Tax=Intrasporangium calvum (strain ATCC 23552 / DSM 43043 / JCM 3097 / NBRC 12989 / NCIMB 10167 / NRRL B-3866 / 7 KIP) TaxID=710696 RepID=E6SB06_INTC7|nr:aminopeptidase N [Intrasporangium calvum]ADU47267.1 Membrane alanyl aminopeptidase [Intrasporangium calvum DSM 43043]
MRSLTLAEARERAELIAVTSYAVELDLDRGDQVFGSVSSITFTCGSPGADSWVDVKARSVEGATLNGVRLDPAGIRDGRLPLPGLAADNHLVVRSTMGYSHDGQGLHRATDPADRRDYVYGHLFLDAAPTVYACFDQPDLKAPYDVTVRAPQDWVVLGNGAASQVAPGRWELATTKPLATYFVTVCAGPYVSVLAEHDGIPLGLHARASLREPLERHAGQLFEVTRQSFDYFHGLFGIRYPFGEYHQVFVPEFNAGAMENPGCVTLRDQYLFRGAATRDELLSRANTVSHEMSHMWFGDLVTMRWWDDLWLNESFAEYMSHRCLVDATEYSDAWVDSSIVRKVWGYGAERSPSTHPVAGVAALDAQSALQNFDGISYAKGAAVLRQLISFVGDDAFLDGVRAYLRDTSHGNGTLADFLGAIERASGRDLGPWSDGWLLTAGRDSVSVELVTGPSGGSAGDPLTGESAAPAVVTSARLLRVPPADHPADRPHALDVAGWRDGVEVVRVTVTVTDDRTPLGDLLGATAPAVLVPNAGDLTWARVRLDDATLDGLPAQLGRVPDAQARAVVWSALIDGVHGAEVSPSTFLDVFAATWTTEANASILARMALYAEHRIVPHFVPRVAQAAALARLADSARELLGRAEEGTTRSLAAARLLAGTSDDETLLRAWAGGSGLPHGLEDDGDFRWIVVRNLAARGLIGASAVDAYRAKDDTLQGGLNALMCRAALPAPAAKAWAWEQLTGRHGRSNYEMVHLARGLWMSPDDALVAGYVDRFFRDVPAMSGWVGEDALSRVVLAAFPKIFTAETGVRSSAALRREDLTPGVRRSLVDADAELREALASRAAFATDFRTPVS